MTLIAHIVIFFICLEIVWNALWAWALFALWLVARLFCDRGIALPRAVVWKGGKP